MQSKKNPWFHIITAIIFCFVIANLVYLNILVLNTHSSQSSVPIAVTPTVGPSQLLLTPTPIVSEEAQKPTPLPSSGTTPTPRKPSSFVKEYFIPFGTGTSSATEWEDLLGLQAYIDGGSYPDIKSVTFEVSLHNVAAGQAVYVRLYNATDATPVWSSDIIYTGGNTSELLISKPISLANSTKLYKVQIKTQLGSPVMIDNSRLRILLH